MSHKLLKTSLIRRGWAVAVFASGSFATLPANAGPQSGNTASAQSDAQLRKQIEGVIQKCIRDKTASPFMCRATSYATALSQGYSPERAAYLTRFKRQK